VRGARPVLLAGVLSLAAACGAPPAERSSLEATMSAALADPARLDADRPRDATSKPAEVLTFLRLERGMRVLDMNAATGWYTEILARVVGPTGHVIAHNHPGASRLPAADLKRATATAGCRTSSRCSYGTTICVCRLRASTPC
jgi:predicted methyltransferase